jgi:hypothetical protein
MLDTTEVADRTLDILRERAAELEQEGQNIATRLDELRKMIAEATRGRPRVRKIRTPAERIAEARAAERSPLLQTPLAAALAQSPPATVEGALDRLGRTVAAREAELEEAGLSDAHLARVA